MANINLKKKKRFSTVTFPEPKPIPEGYLLVDPDDGWNTGGFIFGVVWILVWCGVSFPSFTIMLLEFLKSPRWDTFLPMIFLSLFVAIGVASLVWGGRSLYRLYRIKAGEIILPTYPLEIGGTYRIKYRRQLRQGKTTEEATLSAQWLNYEWVQYRRGTDTVTVTHDLASVDFPERSVFAGVSQLEYETEITVPKDAPPSIYAPNNQVLWELRVNIQVPRIPKDTSYFKLKVLPTQAP